MRYLLLVTQDLEEEVQALMACTDAAREDKRRTLEDVVDAERQVMPRLPDAFPILSAPVAPQSAYMNRARLRCLFHACMHARRIKHTIADCAMGACADPAVGAPHSAPPRDARCY